MSLDNVFVMRNHMFFTGCLVLASVAGCDRGGDMISWELEREQVLLSQRLALQQYRLEQAGPRPDTALLREALETENHARIAAGALRTTKAGLSREIAALAADLESLRDRNVRQRREAAIGRTMATFEAEGGRVYDDVRIMAVNDAGVTLRHRDGSVRLKYSELSMEQREWLGLEHATAVAAEETEREDALAYESWIDQRMSAIRKENERRDEEAADAKQKLRENNRIRAASIAVNSRNSPLVKRGSDSPTRFTVRRRSSGQGATFYNYYRVVRPAGTCGVSQPPVRNAQMQRFPTAPVSRPPVVSTCPVVVP